VHREVDDRQFGAMNVVDVKPGFLQGGPSPEARRKE
jgi:hypothetical protein